MAARDQWAKFILLRHRESYNIYVDEGNLGKAMANSFVKPKIIKLEAKPSPKPSDSGSKSGSRTSDHPSAEELNAKMAQRQKESWNTAKENTNDTAKSDSKPDSDKTTEKEGQEEPVIATEIQDKNKSKFSASDIGFLTGPFIILASRTPAGRRAIGIILGIPGKAQKYRVKGVKYFSYSSQFKLGAFYISYLSAIDHHRPLQVYTKKKAFNSYDVNVSKKVILMNKNHNSNSIYFF